MARRRIVPALALLAFGPGAGAGLLVSGNGPRFPNPSPCTADECRLFLASGCTDRTWVQDSSDDPKPTAGNFASIVEVPPAARGKTGFMESKSGSLRWLVIRTSDCTVTGRPISQTGAGYTIPADAGWLVFYRPLVDVEDILAPGPSWWRWREL